MKALRATWLVTAAATATGALALAAPSPATAAGDTILWAAPGGGGTSCTQSAPCGLATAGDRLTQAATAGQGDTTLYLKGGTYSFTQPFALGEAQSGHNGHHVTITAAPGETPLLSGGQTVTGWSAYGKAGILRAKVPVGAATRQFYVNGKPAERAGAPASQVFGTLTLTGDKKGYSFTNSGARKLVGSTAEVVWTGAAGAADPWQGWTERRCGVGTVTTNLLTPVQPCFTLGKPAQPQGLGTPTRVENSLALLTKPGQYFTDAKAGYVYYMPRAGEASPVGTLPASPGILTGSGVHDLTLQGLSFAYTSWEVPNNSTGFIDGQANFFRQPDGSEQTPPGALTFSNSHDLLLDSLKVFNTGGAGIVLKDGTHDNKIQHSEIYQTAATGIQMGGGDASRTTDLRNEVNSSDLHDLPTMYHGGVGVWMGYVRDSTIQTTSFERTVYSAISLGWGWGQKSILGNNKISHNAFSSILNGDLFDGGAIYVNGVSDPNARSSIDHNYINGVLQPWGAIYLDGSASNWDVTANAVKASKTNWLYLQDVSGQDALYNHVWANCSETTQERGTTKNPSNVVEGNTYTSNCG